jgi:hypothetical protein
MPEELTRPRTREALAIDIAIDALSNGVDEIPVDFFGCEEEIEIAESLTEEETIRAAAVVMEALAKHTLKPTVQRAAYRVSAVLHTKATAYTRAAGKPRVYGCRPRDRRPRTRRVRARAGASRDGPSSSDEDPSDLDLDSCFSPAPSGLFCVPSHARRLSAESSSPEPGGTRGEEASP